MADPVSLKDLAVWLGGYDFTATLNQINLSAAKKDLPNSRFSVDTLETFHPGIQMIDAGMAGFFTAGAGEADEVMWARIDPAASPSAWPYTVAPPFAPTAAAGASGNVAFIVASKQFEYKTGAKHGDSLPYSVTHRGASGGFYRGNVMLPKASRVATTTGTGYQLGAVGATQKLVGVLHVFAVTGGTWVLTVESDDNSGFTSATVRQTFTGATAITTQIMETNGPITDDYWRVVLTKTGGTSCTAAALLAIAPQ